MSTKNLKTTRDFCVFNNRPQIEAILKGFPLPQEEILRLIGIAEAHWYFDYGGDPTRPHALLTSGKHSVGYINCPELFQYPLIKEVMAAQQARILMDAGIEFGSIDWVLGSPMAGITFSDSVAGFLGARSAYTEEKDGVKKLVRFGIKPGDTVLQIEELVTEATTLRAQQTALMEATDGGAKLIPFVGIFFNRSGETKFGDQQYVSVVDQNMPRWTPEDCPHCRNGSEAIPPKKPHSNWVRLTTKPEPPLGWSCPSCQSGNPGSNTICQQCGTSKQMA
ncbi:MAG: hypothetical protein HZC01_01685 [Candidatus Kerfeldbacteria bacterium]|nr:hypothetical protein [Candidatus Kerfeldbacteria bacterium]